MIVYRGMHPRENLEKLSNLVRFGVFTFANRENLNKTYNE